MLRAILALGLVAVATAANLRYDVTQAKAADKASNGAATRSTLKQMQLKLSTPEFKVSAGDTYEDRNGVNFQHPYHMDHAKNCDEEHHHASDSEDHLAELTSECMGRGGALGARRGACVCWDCAEAGARLGAGWGGERGGAERGRGRDLRS
jgi:hypothetical protein